MDPWLHPLPDAAQMRAIDSWAIEQEQVPSLQLMERAGLGLASLVAQCCPNGKIVVVCGKGNNGGDGLVAARHLHDWGHAVEVLSVGSAEELKGDAKANFERLSLTVKPFEEQALADADCIVDALLGTGFSGQPREPIAGAIEAINRAGAVVVSADIPSGVDASSGEVTLAVRATATATFHSSKLGLAIWPGKEYAGEVEVVEIGIPSGDPVEVESGLITDAVLGSVPRRGERSSKFTAGVVTVVGGSTGLTGAPCLTVMAAQRTGAGYVTAAVPVSLNLVFEQRLLEAMTTPLPDLDGALSVEAVAATIESLARTGALVIGPGIGRRKETRAFVRKLLAEVCALDDPPRVVIDADGLNAFSGLIEELKAVTEHIPVVLTPHEGELARLLEIDSEQVAQQRLSCARLLAEKTDATVVLKGDDTLVVAPDGRVAVSEGGCPMLATAGTGDVLSGILAALLAKDLDVFTATCAAVNLHLQAGKLVTTEIGPEGAVASDLLPKLPLVLYAHSG